MKKGHELRLYDYQARMKARIEDAFGKYQSVMAQMPTGTGKTHVVASVVRDFVRDGASQVWVVAHRQELVVQMRNTLKLYLDSKEMKMILVTSIQWLSRHIDDMAEAPSLIVIDEAHHAIAKTYAMMMNRYPHAKKLGVTATPYRLSGEGFTSMFETLLTSWDIKKFIEKGYLCPYDYYSIANNAIELLEIRNLKMRGTDGDYLTGELDSKLNTPKFIERLFDTYMKYAKGKKGFVYAINIRHAENVARYYNEHGVSSVAISSKTPKKEREREIEAFRRGETTVLCSVDLFSEGFDAPDAEFVQLARPTLSLAKYLQMVGRGLRTAPGKKTCVILDNAGLSKIFGYPDAHRDWSRWFNGLWKDIHCKYVLDGPIDRSLGMHVGPEQDMYLSASYSRRREHEEQAKMCNIVADSRGQYMLTDKDGKTLLPAKYNRMEWREDGILFVQSFGKGSEWYDLLNGLTYEVSPETDYIGSIPMAIVGRHYYPRLRSKWTSHGYYLSMEQMKSVSGEGIDWMNENAAGQKARYYIPWNGVPKIYRIVREEIYGARLLEDENGGMYVQRNPDSPVITASRIHSIGEYFERCRRQFSDFAQQAKKYNPFRANVNRLKRHGYFASLDINDVYRMSDNRNHTPDFWVDRITGRVFRTEPKPVERGAIKLLCVGDFVFVRDSRVKYPYQDWQIKADDKSYWILNREYRTQ